MNADLRIRFLSAFICVHLCSSAYSIRARAEPVADFYHGHDIELVVVAPAGGGYDLLARILARHLPKHIPGEPAIVVKNMPGAGGLIAANYLYNQAPRDGSVIAALIQDVAFQPLFGEKQARFDATRFTWIGNANSETGVFYVRASSPIATFADLRTTEVPAAATQGGSATAFNYRILNAVLGTRIKIVTGYPGSNESFLALERGEVEGFFSLWSTLKARGRLVADHQVRVIVQLALEKSPELPDVPLAADFTQNDADRQALALAEAPSVLGRPYVAPPEVPAERAQALEQAFLAATADPDFTAEVANARLEADHILSGTEALALLRRFYATPPAVVARVSAIAKGQ